MSINIHPTAQVAEGAQISDGVVVGPYSIIGPNVVLKENVQIHSHVVIEGHTTVGEMTSIYPFAVIGMPPQNMHYHNEPSTVEIGCSCVIREHVTIHPGTEKGGMKTVVGDNCYLMINVHIGHDCIIENNVVMANGATLGGHVHVGEFANIGGLAAIHQFVRIGSYAMISGTAGVKEDIIPYGMVMAMQGRLGGLNLIGMKRRGIQREDIHNLRNAYKILAKTEIGSFEDRLKLIETQYADSKSVQALLGFIRSKADRPLCVPSDEFEFETDDSNGGKRAA